MTAPGDLSEQEDGLREAIARALTAHYPNDSINGRYCECRGWDRLVSPDVTFAEHLADAVLALPEVAGLRAKVERVEALADEWEGWSKNRSTPRIDAFRDAAESLRAALASRPTTHESAEEGEV